MFKISYEHSLLTKMKRQNKIRNNITHILKPFLQLKVNILQPFVSFPVVRKKVDIDMEKVRCVMQCDNSGFPFDEQKVS